MGLMRSYFKLGREGVGVGVDAIAPMGYLLVAMGLFGEQREWFGETLAVESNVPELASKNCGVSGELVKAGGLGGEKDGFGNG